MEMAVKNLCEGSQHASEDVHKVEGHDRDRTDVSGDTSAQKRMKNFLTFCPHRMSPKLLSLFFLLSDNDNNNKVKTVCLDIKTKSE
jgi:hypothetical protein